MDTVPLDPYTAQTLAPTTVPIDSNNRPYQPVIDPEVAQMRAFKAAYGLKDVDRYPQQTIYNNMVNGAEDVYRKQVAQDIDQKKAQDNMDFLIKLNQTVDLTPDQFQFAVDALDKKKEDPETVFERAYGKRYSESVDRAAEARGDTWVPNANQSLPDVFRNVKAVASDLITKQQALRRLAQDIQENDVKNQSWLGWGADLAKQMFQPYVEVKSRGNVPGVGKITGGILLGTNLQEQGEHLLHMELPDMMTTVKKFIDPMRKDNPSQAVAILNQLAGMTSEEKIFNNLTTVMMPVDAYSIATGFKDAASKAPSKLIKTDLLSGKTLDETIIRPRDASKEFIGPRLPKAGDAAFIGPIKNAFQGVVRSSADEPHNVARMASSAGDLQEAGIKDAAAAIDTKLKGNVEDVQGDLNAMTTNFRVDKEDLAHNQGVRGQDIANRVIQAYDRKETDVQKGILSRQRVDKLPGVFESEDAVRDLEASVRNSGEYKGIPSAVGDIDFLHNKASNTYSYRITLTNHDGQLFDIPETAHGWARLNGITISADDIKQQGVGFKIVLTKPLKETDSVVRDLLIPTKMQTEPQGWLRSWIGWAVNPDETLSLSHRQARKTAAYGPSHLMKVAAADARIIKSFARGATMVDPITGATVERKWLGIRGRYQDWERMVKAMRTAPDPDRVDGGSGRWFKSVGEVEEYYSSHYHRLPEEAEVQAYFAYKRINEYDRVLRDLRHYSNMWREGVQAHTMWYKGEDGKSIAHPTFHGTKTNQMPGGDGKVLFVRNGNLKDAKAYMGGQLGTAHKEIKEGLLNGEYQMIKIWNPDEKPFAGFGPITPSNWLQYVIAPSFESKNIQFNALPRRGGGHWDVDHPFYLKQAKVYFDRPAKAGDRTGFVHTYAGDTTIMPIQIRAMGETVAKHLNAIRQLIAGKSFEEAKTYHNAHANEIGVPWNNVRSWFEKRTVDGKVQPPLLSLEHDIRVVPKDKNIADMDNALKDRYNWRTADGRTGNSFKNGTQSGNPSRQSQIQYSGLRDSDEPWTLVDKGTKDNPLYAYEPATFVDPIETMNRALTKITQSTYLEDYKQFAVEHWFAQYKDYLQDSDKVGVAPYHYFYDPKWVSGFTNTEGHRNAMASNWNIRQFLGVSNPVDLAIKNTTQKLIDNVYGKFGPNATKLVPNWMLFGMRDPVNWIKQVTYHTSIGLFSIPQIFVQAQTMALIVALSPRSAMSGMFGAMMHQWARVNPNMVETLDKYMSKFTIPGFHSYKPGEFIEARELGYHSGFLDVQGEHAAIDDVMNGNKLVRGLGRDFLEWGTTPFKGGERHVRMSAWYTAYREFREAHPTGRITDKEANIILNRADDLYGNMSRASSSAMHSGVFSIPTQFLSYQLRISELFLGSRTTALEKARMFGTFAALYGVPGAVGLSGLPLGDYFRKKALEEGYVVGDNWISSVIGEGLPAVVMAAITGGGDISKGNFYDVAGRYSSNGMEPIRDILRGDKSVFSMLGGAAWSKISGLLEGMDPFYQFMMSAIRDDDKAFTITQHDLIRPLEEVNSLGNGVRTIAGINTGRFLSKKGIYLDDVSPLNAMFMGITGLSPTKVTDAYNMAWTIKDRENLETWGRKKFEEYWHNGLRLAKDDPESARDFFKNAFVYLWIAGVRDDRLSEILATASQDNLSLVNQLEWSYYIDKAPQYAKQTMYDAFERRQKMSQGQ